MGIRVALLAMGTLCASSLLFPAAAQDSAIRCNSHVRADIISGCTDIINAGRESPQHLAMAYTYRGAAYSDQGDSDKAIADYSNAIRLYPTDPIAYFDRGVEYGAAGKLNLSISDFSQAIALKPDYARAYLDRGKIYQASGDNQRAQADFNKAQSLGAN